MLRCQQNALRMSLVCITFYLLPKKYIKSVAYITQHNTTVYELDTCLLPNKIHEIFVCFLFNGKIFKYFVSITSGLQHIVKVKNKNKKMPHIPVL